MLVSLTGRKGAGKSTLARVLQGVGFHKVSVADYLKELVAQVYGWSLSSLYDNATKEEVLATPVRWGPVEASRLAQIIGATRPVPDMDQEIPTRRYALQFVGTEVLRTYDPDFHVSKMCQRMESGQNYVVDDVRFQNELGVLKNQGAVCVYIVRPDHFDGYSNHASEVSLRRHDFENVLVNWNTERSLVKRFLAFLLPVLRTRTHSVTKSELLSLFRQHDFQTSAVALALGCSRDWIVKLAARHMIHVPETTYHCDEDAFARFTPEAAYWAGVLSADGCVTSSGNHRYVVQLPSTDRELADGFRAFMKSDGPLSTYRDRRHPHWKTVYTVKISSPFVTDDMKLWNLEPRKSRCNKVPELIRDNPELVANWLVGLIDGDGSIYVRSTLADLADGPVDIDVLASRPIAEFVLSLHPYGCGPYQKSGTEGLFSVRFHGPHARRFYDAVYRPIGLQRKWRLLSSRQEEI